ncbi:MAG: RES family NAD+ phosphorylase [Acidimicrobiales bacterium]
MRWFRHCDPRYPFLCETAEQPPARWHGPGERPARYFADTPAGAWAEHLRHEAITDPEDLVDVTRSLWAIEVPDNEVNEVPTPSLATETLTGGLDSHQACQEEASRLRTGGAGLLTTPAALLAGGATPQRTDRGLRSGLPADGRTLVLFGPRSLLDGWKVVEGARLDAGPLGVTRQL